jgi:UDP-N-acetylglucosamine 2-epimerase (non-hydrolysing)
MTGTFAEQTAANVIPMRPLRRDALPAGGGGRTKVLYAVASDDGLVEVASVIAALERKARVEQIVVHAERGPGAKRDADEAPTTKVHHLLGAAAGSHAERTAATLTAFDAILRKELPDVVVVGGDEDAELAAALAAAKRKIAVAHLRSGMRAWDWTQPEEVNRSLIDSLSDTLFTSSAEAEANLIEEGVPAGRVYRVGNTRIDLLRQYEGTARKLAAWSANGAEEGRYALVALRRPSTLAPADRLSAIAAALGRLAEDCDVLLLLHPATRALLESEEAQALLTTARVRSVEPAAYVETLSLQLGAGSIITDAAVVQEEASALGIACHTLGATASTVTLTHGTNVLLDDDPEGILEGRISGRAPTPAAIPLWDGRAGERVADALVANYVLASTLAGDR